MARVNKKAATRKDVAELAGVAPPTVSLVLNNNPGTRIPETTRQRILDAAKELRYHPSPIARALVCKKTMNIGIALHYVSTPFDGYISSILDGFWKKSGEENYRLVLGQGEDDKALAGMYLERGVDGIAVFVPPLAAVDEELIDAVKAGFPLVFLGSYPDNFPVNYVDIDNRAAGEWATNRLIENGHKRILHLAGPLGINSSAVERRQGYLDALKKGGIPVDPELIYDCSYSAKVVAIKMREILKRGIHFTAIFAASHAMAIEAVVVLMEMGLQIPRDVSVTSIDRYGAKKIIGIDVTTVGIPLERIGCTAFEVLKSQIDGSAKKPRKIYLEPEIIEGSTVAKVKS